MIIGAFLRTTNTKHGMILRMVGMKENMSDTDNKKNSEYFNKVKREGEEPLEIFSIFLLSFQIF